LLRLLEIEQKYFQGNMPVNIFKNLDFKINEPKNIGIIGPSGSGKTSLLNIIGLIEKPKSGKYFFNNLDCLDLSNLRKTEFRKKNIGYIFQNNQLLEDFNVQENVALPLILNGENYNKACDKARNFLKLFSLEKRMTFKPGVLSGGEQQRVAVARAMIKKPSVLLADEPTGSLDDNTAEIVFKYITDLSKKNNTLTIIATHNTKFIKKLDICFKINEGKLIEI
jgi:lipoprotein-releasing system ATP-binding protein|tara:strand:- start:404 stop:1072 length:669 start_codon:yes stop_codon:yes gene_type:complete